MLWCDLAVTPHFSWPNTPVSVPFEGKRIVLSPPTDELACRVSLWDPNRTTFEIGGTLLSRFLSRLSWSRRAGIVELFVGGSNMPTRPGLLGQGRYERSSWATIDPPRFIYLPLASSAEADLALALYRSGVSANSAPFRFLSFFKILNIRHASGAAQENWINGHLSSIARGRAADRLRELQAQHSDVGKYMYVQGRCAVAHANASPIVNPDNYVERRRLEADLPLMQELAELFIEIEFGVRSESDVLRSDSGNGPNPELLILAGEIDGFLSYAPYTRDA